MDKQSKFDSAGRSSGSGLRICTWTGNGSDIVGEEAAIAEFLFKEQIDVLLLANILISNKEKFRIPNYIYYMTMHPKDAEAGGTGILIKKKIKHKLREPYVRLNLRSTSVTIEADGGVGGGKELTLAAIYWLSWLDYAMIEAQLAYLFYTLGDRFLAAGSYNAKHTHWGCQTNDNWGEKLYNVIANKENELNFITANKSATLAVIKGIDKNLFTTKVSYNLLPIEFPVLYVLHEKSVMHDVAASKGCLISSSSSAKTLADTKYYEDSSSNKAAGIANLETIFQLVRELDDVIKERHLTQEWQNFREATTKLRNAISN